MLLLFVLPQFLHRLAEFTGLRPPSHKTGATKTCPRWPRQSDLELLPFLSYCASSCESLGDYSFFTVFLSPPKVFRPSPRSAHHFIFRSRLSKSVALFHLRAILESLTPCPRSPLQKDHFRRIWSIPPPAPGEN